jgi:hypothetical protein
MGLELNKNEEGEYLNIQLPLYLKNGEREPI